MINESEMFNIHLEMGYKFQSYVQTLFPEPIYSIVHRTSHFQDSKTLMDNLPDFIIRANYNNTNFAVECKFRSEIKEKNFLIKKDQLDFFKDYRDKNNIDVFVVVGSGIPETPESIFILPLIDNLFKLPFSTKEFLYNFERKHNGYFIYDKGYLK
ncbi:MAG: hypothetical protein ABFD15_04015 [Methanofastidiosum sp.]